MMRKREDPHHRVWVTTFTWKRAVHIILYDFRTIYKPSFWCYLLKNSSTKLHSTHGLGKSFSYGDVPLTNPTVVPTQQENNGLPVTYKPYSCSRAAGKPMIFLPFTTLQSISCSHAVQFSSVKTVRICKPCSVQFSSVVKSCASCMIWTPAASLGNSRYMEMRPSHDPV